MIFFQFILKSGPYCTHKVSSSNTKRFYLPALPKGFKIKLDNKPCIEAGEGCFESKKYASNGLKKEFCFIISKFLHNLKYNILTR